MEFDIWSKNNRCASANIIPGIGRKMWGVVYEIPVWLLTRESSGPRTELSQWRKIREPVLTYVGFNHQQGIKTSLEYVKHMFAGLREHEIPNEYVEYAKTRVIANNPDLKSALNSITHT